jgi:hypothetical protein
MMVPEKVVERVKVGNSVKARFQAFSWKTYSGTVTKVGPRTTEEIEKIFNVKYVISCEIKLDEFPANVKYGMRAHVMVSGRRTADLKPVPIPKSPADSLERFINPSVLEAKAQKLKQRYEKIKDVFADELPNIIVPTQFIIGAEKNKQHPDHDGEKRLYELQPKISSLRLSDTRDVHEYVFNGGESEHNYLYYNPQEPIPKNILGTAKIWATQINENFPNQRQQIKDELKKFIELSRPIPERMNEIPYDMVHPANVGFTSDGIRIPDINLVLPNLEATNKWRKTLFNPDIWLARYNRLLDIWQIVYDEL